MTEQGPTAGDGNLNDNATAELKVIQELGRNKILDRFKRNFKMFVDRNIPQIRLVTLGLTQNQDRLMIDKNVSGEQTDIPYFNLNKDFERIFEPYREKGISPIVSPAQTVTLSNHVARLSQPLKAYAGQTMEVVRINYLLHSSRDERTGIVRDRYFNPGDRENPIAELWTAQRFKIKPVDDEKSPERGLSVIAPNQIPPMTFL